MIKIIIQARMGSRRLPGKMAMPIIDNKGALELMIERVRQVQLPHMLIVATSDLPEDNVIMGICNKLNVVCFRGSSSDVLERYFKAAMTCGERADTIVRLTGDCPLNDANMIEEVIAFYTENQVAYVSNTDPPTYPDGLDVEVMSLKALEYAHLNAKKDIEREHVTVYIRENKAMFKSGNVSSNINYSDLRWTLDEPEDFDFIKAVYQDLYPKNPKFKMDDILQLCKDKPELLNINKQHQRNEAYHKQVKESNDQ